MADPTLAISSESVCFIIGKVRALDDELAARELRSFIVALSDEQQVDLVVLMWLGRGDGVLDDWDDLRDEAFRQHDDRAVGHLLSEPLLSDHLEEGLSQFGFAGADFEIDRQGSLPPVFV
jgi:uncharacterized protein DUF3775